MIRHNQTKTKTDDRRSILRRHLIYYLRVWDLQTNKLLGHIIDINSGGFMLISEKEIPLEKTFKLEIRWITPEEEEVNIQFRAESRWKANDVNSSFYNTGFKLLDPVDAALEPIRKMIEEYGFQD